MTRPTISIEESNEAWFRLGREATTAYVENGDYRRGADLFLKAFQSVRDKRHNQRYFIFQSYCTSLIGMYFKPSRADFKALKRVLKDQSELRLFRAQAVFTLAQLQWYCNHHRDEAGDSFRDVVGFAELVSSEESELRFMTHDPGGNEGGGKLVSEILADMSETAQDSYLNHLLSEGMAHDSEPNQYVIWEYFWARADDTFLPEHGRETKFGIGPQGVSISESDIRRLLTVGGECCDVCGKTRAEAEMVCLDCCSRCKRVYFCSETCQREQWLNGHREHCRKPGEYQAGDYVVIWNLQVKPELNGQVVQIDGPSPTRPDKWAVRKPGFEQVMSIAADKLHHLRPLK